MRRGRQAQHESEKRQRACEQDGSHDLLSLSHGSDIPYFYHIPFDRSELVGRGLYEGVNARRPGPSGDILEAADLGPQASFLFFKPDLSFILGDSCFFMSVDLKND